MAVGATLANIFTFTSRDPLRSHWDPTVEFRYRFSPTAQYYTALAVVWQAAISDLALCVDRFPFPDSKSPADCCLVQSSAIPVFFVWKLQMPLSKKPGPMGLLGGSMIAFL